jgi:outer membrane protein TolC
MSDFGLSNLGDLMLKRCSTRLLILTVAAFSFFTAALQAQQATVTIDIKTALERARTYSPQFQSASLAVDLARIDRYVAKMAFYPSANYFNQYIHTQGNGTPSGIFVSNDGVHVYNSQAIVHQEVYAPGRTAEYRRAIAAEAVTAARRDVALAGIVTTVFQSYYAIVTAQRHLTNAQQSLDESKRFVSITEKLESGGEVAHADVVKAQLTLQQRERDVQDAQFSVEKNKIALAVLIFPDLTTNYAVVDDLNTAPTLESFDRIQALAYEISPDLRLAQATLKQEGYGVAIARSGYLPSFSFDYFFGINNNQFAVHDEEGRNRLGSVAQATLNIPVFNWWTTHSKIRQAELKRQQAQLDLTLTQRELNSSLRTSYLEARAAQAQMDSLRRSLDLATESLRLTNLRYEAGESTVLEVVDAQTTLAQARNAYDDGLSRYRIALATIQTLTGNY